MFQLILLVLVLLPFAHGGWYLQTNSYEKTSNCDRTPWLLSSQLQPSQCIQPSPQDTCSINPSTSVYASTSIQCLHNEPLTMSGIKQNMVAIFTFTSSEQCQGDAATVSAYVADAECHPLSDKLWFKMNCNGNRPVLLTCKDKECGASGCEAREYTGGCELVGAGASTQAVCVQPGMHFEGGFQNRSSGSTTSVGKNGAEQNAGGIHGVELIVVFWCSLILIVWA